MLRYSINKVCYDYCQFLLVYSYDEFIEEIRNKLDYFEMDPSDKYENILDDPKVKNIINAIVEIDIEDINDDFDFVEDIEPSIEIIKNNLNKEITIIYSSPILDYEYELKLPNYIDISKSDYCINDEDLEKIIEYILIKKGFCSKIEVDTVSKDSDVYVEMFSSEMLLDNDSVEPFYISSGNPSELIGKKIGDLIYVKNPLNSTNNNHKICKIINNVPNDLTNEIVQKINFRNIDDVNTFKEEIRLTYKKIIGFNKTIALIYEKLNSINNINISIFSYNHYKKANDLSKEKIYDIIKSKYIDTYLREQYYDDDDNEISTKGLDNYFKSEYEMLQLFSVVIDLPFEDYLDARKDDANLYTLIKNRR